MHDPSQTYFVLVTDIVRSRDLVSRSEFSDTLTHTLKGINNDWASSFAAPLVQTKGLDELSGILKKADHLAHIIFSLSVGLYPQVVRYSLGVGDVSPFSEDASKADGPAFHKASALLDQAELSHQLCQLDEALGQEVAALAQALTHSSLKIIAGWPKSAAKVTQLAWRSPNATLEELANTLKISTQAVSKSLQRTRYKELLENQRVLTDWLKTV